MFRLALCAILALPVVANCDDSDSTSKAVVNLLIKQLKDRDPKKRTDAAAELGKLGTKARGASRPLCEACMDSNGKVSVAAIDALEKIRPDLHKHIVIIVSDSDTAKHTRAFRSIADLKEEGNPVVPILLEYIKRADLSGKVNLGSPSQCVALLVSVANDDPTIMPTLNNAI